MKAGEAGADSHCAQVVRAADPDRYAAALFVPARRRAGLLALYAFSQEVARTRESVSESMLGEIRLQWWRETLDGIAQGKVRDHPVAQSLAAAVRAHDLPLAELRVLIDARAMDLAPEPTPLANEAALESYAAATAGQLILLADRVVRGRDPAPGSDETARAAGCAWALTGLLRALPYHARRRQVFIPRSILDRHEVDLETLFAGHHTPELACAMGDITARARVHLATARASGAARGPAFLYLALTDLYLGKLERPGFDPFRRRVEISPFRRLWRLWTMAIRRKV